MEKTRSPAQRPATRPCGNSTPSTKSQTYPAYPETMMASCLLREGMDESVVQSLLLKGHCKVAALIVLSGKSLSDLAAATNDNALKNRRNVEYIRTALVKLRIALPPPHPSFLAPVSTTESKYSAAASQPTLSSLPTSSPLSPISTDQQLFADQQLPKIPELPQPQSATVRETSLSEHEQMLRVLREFPIAYEQYARENGLDVATLSSASNSGGGSGTSSGGSALVRPSSGEITDVGFMCGTMPNDTSLWNIITEALGLVDFFGLVPALGEQKEFSSVDQIVDEFCSSTGLPPAPAPFRPKSKVGGAKRKKKLGPLEVPVAPSLPAMHLRPPPVGDWSQKETAGPHLRDESRRLFKILSGLTRGESIPILNWEFKLTKSRVTVHQAMMPGSPWAAIKSDCIIHADKHRICKLITTDERSHEYDEQVDGFELLQTVDDKSRVRHYRFKPIWPTTPRDFVMLTSWCELDDGCIMVSSISPPNEYMGKVNGYTRAYLLSSGALLRPIESRLGGGTHVTFVTHCDAGGSIPAFVLNILSTGSPVRTLSRVCEISEKEEKEEKIRGMF